MKYLIPFMLLGIILISACIQSSNTTLLSATEACGMFTNAGVVASVSCPYTNSKINDQKYLTSEFCDTAEKVDISKKPFSYFKSNYINSLDIDDLKTVYCEVASETAPKVYRYIRKNNDITHLFFSSASPCKEYNFYILPQSVEPLVDIVKSEHVSSMNPEGDIMYLIETTPTQITKKGNTFIISSEKYTCV